MAGDSSESGYFNIPKHSGFKGVNMLRNIQDQISLMRSRFPDYKSYADQTLSNVFTLEELRGAAKLTATYLQTAYFQGTTYSKFRLIDLPQEAQFSPIFTMTSLDYNDDGHPDLLLAGNINQARQRFGKYAANYGLLLKGDGKGTFTTVPQFESGFRLTGDVRSILCINHILLFGINQRPIRAFQPTQP